MGLPNEVQVGSWNALLGKLLDISHTPSPTIATDIFPTIQLAGDRPEWEFLRGGRLLHAGAADPAAAGSYSHVGLFNPTGSGVLAVVHQTSVMNGGAGLPQLNLISSVAGWTLLGSAQYRDPRTANSSCKVYTFTNAVLTGTFMAWPTYRGTVGAGTYPAHFTYDSPVVLPPGYGLVAVSSGFNIGCMINAAFVERQLLPSETR